MIDDCKKWLCELTMYYIEGWGNYELEILICAMWAINREEKWRIDMAYNRVDVWIPEVTLRKSFKYKNHNNSETLALTKALEYIYIRKVNEA